MIGVLTALELFMSRADERENEFLLRLLEKHHARLKAQFDRHVVGFPIFSSLWSIAYSLHPRMNKLKVLKTRNSLAGNVVALSSS